MLFAGSLPYRTSFFSVNQYLISLHQNRIILWPSRNANSHFHSHTQREREKKRHTISSDPSNRFTRKSTPCQTTAWHAIAKHTNSHHFTPHTKCIYHMIWLKVAHHSHTIKCDEQLILSDFLLAVLFFFFFCYLPFECLFSLEHSVRTAHTEFTLQALFRQSILAFVLLFASLFCVNPSNAHYLFIYFVMNDTYFCMREKRSYTQHTHIHISQLSKSKGDGKLNTNICKLKPLLFSCYYHQMCVYVCAFFFFSSFGFNRSLSV